MTPGQHPGTNPSHHLHTGNRRRLLGGSVLAIAYYAFVRLTGVGIPCPIYSITGHWCPSCGVTRMALAITTGKLGEAWQANRLLAMLSPYLLLLLIRFIYAEWVGKPLRIQPLEKYVQILIIILLLIFGVLRNLSAFAHWAPQAGSIP